MARPDAPKSGGKSKSRGGKPTARPQASFRASRKSAAKPNARGHDPITAALSLAALQGWRRTNLSDIAAEAGLSLAELHAQYRSKHEILVAWMARVDAEMLAALDPGEAKESHRDRLFSVIMRRLDALERHKLAVRSILRDVACDPAEAVALGLCAAPRSLVWMLEAAGLESTGLRGRLRLKGLGLIYAQALQTWLSDDSADLAKTMATLDRALQRAAAIWRRVFGGFERSSKSTGAGKRGAKHSAE